MDDLKRRWNLYVIHHSHTDIGYTDRQEKIERYHVDFIKRVIEVTEQIQSDKRPEWEGFRWTCETFWAVERFLERASPDWQARFIRALQSGSVELSANYLNMTELIDVDLLQSLIRKSVQFGNSVGIRVDCAMTADINGYGWGFSQALMDEGVQNLFSCVHTHHGMYPVFQKQIPFWWETPTGQRLLVWNGEHYHFGNQLGLVPSTEVTDEYLMSADDRITAYLAQLEREDYPYDFVPVMASGAFTDNGPPNADIMQFIHRWNTQHGERVNIRMATLSEFFTVLRQHPYEIPTYRGDWPDWWSDGVGSTPLYTQIFRDAQRTLRLLKRLDPSGHHLNAERIGQAEHQLALYAEHTWGYASSVHEPWNPYVAALSVRKEAYAANAHRLVYTELDEVLSARGEAKMLPGRPKRYRVINAFEDAVTEWVPLYLDHFESRMEDVEVVEDRDGGVLNHQVAAGNRGMAVWVEVHLGPYEEKTLTIRSRPQSALAPTTSFGFGGTDGVVDIKRGGPSPLPSLSTLDDGVFVSESSLETPFVRIEWKPGVGIVSWIDTTRGEEMLRRDYHHAAFTPVYERTKAGGRSEMTSVRRKMGRNRKGMHVERTGGRLVRVAQVTNGPLFVTVELTYSLPGTSDFVLVLTAYRHAPRVDVAVRLHKESIWEPENLYVSLPFTYGNEAGSQLWIDKAGALMRPTIDQLPGTCTDFYSVQEGLCLVGPDGGLAIGLPDTPLLQLGTLEYGERMLQGHPDLCADKGLLYAWVLNNMWETNFKATTGGFYEFRYYVCWGADLQHAETAMQHVQRMNMGVVSFRASEPDAVNTL